MSGSMIRCRRRRGQPSSRRRNRPDCNSCQGHPRHSHTLQPTIASIAAAVFAVSAAALWCASAVEALRFSAKHALATHNVRVAAAVDGAPDQKALSFLRVPMAARANPALRIRSAVVSPALQRRDGNTASESLTGFATVVSEYEAQLLIGSPGQTFRVLFDTGSYWTWVKSSFCETDSCQSSNRLVNTSSSTYTSTGVAAPSIAYVDGTVVSGVVANDTLTVGSVTAPGFAFVSALNVTSNNPTGDHDYDGIVGASLPPTAPPTGTLPTFFDQLAGASGVVAAAQLGYVLFPGDSNGEVTVGGYDADRFANISATPDWVSVSEAAGYVSYGTWALPLASITAEAYAVYAPTVSTATAPAGATVTPYSFATGSTAAMIDTGDSFAVVPAQLVTDVATWLGCAYSSSYGVYLCDCALRAASAGPVLAFSFEATSASSSPVTLLATSAEYVMSAPAALNLSTCLLALSGTTDAAATTYTLGNTILKRYYTVFDYTQRRVGFALAAGRDDGLDGAAASSATAAAGHGASTAVGAGSSFTSAAVVSATDLRDATASAAGVPASGAAAAPGGGGIVGIATVACMAGAAALLWL
ncbi:hypothetical protein HK405_010633 [Cladochytrium tenue]|nr:hypothetical protein HK405_010633 [Cladochytrium tenue]